MKNRFFTVAFSLLFVHQLARFLVSIDLHSDDDFDEAVPVSDDKPSLIEAPAPFYKRDFPLSQYTSLSNTVSHNMKFITSDVGLYVYTPLPWPTATGHTL